MSPLVEFDRITVEYGRRNRLKRAVDDVSLDVREGEALGLIGESGSGKSTLSKTLLGQVPVTSGRVLFDGADITRLGARDRRGLSRRIQVVFQNPYSSLNPQRTIAQSVGETLATDTGLTRQDVRRRVLEMLEQVGLSPDAADKFPAAFSGGQRQRIAIARALLPMPDLVICDEAVSALDLSVQAQVLNLLADLQDRLGLAYLFITHDLAVVRHFCHRMAVLKGGRLVETGQTEAVCARPRHDYTRTLLASAPVADPDAQAAARARRHSLAQRAMA
ncbi:ATP-binding cassette domain-containing protein [Streptomyces sp. Caat 7-52]|uniref:ATP-binding cassette domain-containing protein n=1 Tax=Streptomyces sp. Caat 7-52 TaxID=2949637 RepID=UPI0020363BAD|nr:ATP-binding cassette domain-containing protein [Streptomyces sp. Caat 7-52]